MNKDTFQGNFKALKGKLKEKWGKLTDDDITRIEGKKEQLFGLLQSKYGITKEKAQTELNDLLNRWESDQFTSHWDSIRSKLQEKFNTLSSDEIAKIKGRRDDFIKLLETKYHVTRDQAVEKLQGFIESLHLDDSRHFAGVGSKQQPSAQSGKPSHDAKQNVRNDEGRQFKGKK